LPEASTLWHCLPCLVSWFVAWELWFASNMIQSGPKQGNLIIISSHFGSYWISSVFSENH
jgi:hypothetical protein